VAVLQYLDSVDPEAARRARQRYGCFEASGSEPQDYGYSATLGLSPSCRRNVVAQLEELRRRATDYMSRDGFIAEDEYFFAEQNARLVRNAEQCYRSMFSGRVERYVNRACLIGFTTHTGTVTAARDWGEPAERRQVRPSIHGSYERLFHETEIGRFILRLAEEPVRTALMTPRFERAIGVVYKPETERASHDFRARLPEQFDVVIHLNTTTALAPLERWSSEEADLPETYPTGV
jgi:erythromycin esterase-like protein